MIDLDDICCQRGHETHQTKMVHINFGKDHGFGDLPQVPSYLHRQFAMWVWDPAVYPIDGKDYCPAHDAVSETIVNQRIWEPAETIMASHVFSTADRNQIFVDCGAQIGWFSLLAASYRLAVQAYDADPECNRILRESAFLDGWGHRVSIKQVRFGVDSPPTITMPVRLAKIDVEGAEDKVVKWLTPTIDQGMVDHILIEVSPVFADYYSDLVLGIMDKGYDLFRVPPKCHPPHLLSHIPDDLLKWQVANGAARAYIAGIDQENFWLKRQGAEW